DRFQRASKKPAPGASDARRHRKRKGCQRQTHLLGHGDRRRLRAHAPQRKEGRGEADRGSERGTRRQARGGRDKKAALLEMPHQPARPLLVTRLRRLEARPPKRCKGARRLAFARSETARLSDRVDKKTL